jgi:hypothetical protein
MMIHVCRSFARLAVFACFAASTLLAQSGAASSSSPPQYTAMRHAGPRTYRFIVVYYTASPSGQVVHRQRVSGDYTRGLPQDQIEWNHVTLADASDDKAPFAAPQESAFMDGFQYPGNADSTAPDFFKSFPELFSHR